MNKIEQMVKEMCPGGVKCVFLGSLIELYTGEQFNKSELAEIGMYPVINGGVLPSGYSDKKNESFNTITISQGGASAGYVSYQKTDFWAGAHCFVVRPKGADVLNNRYLYHFLKECQSKLQSKQQGAGIPSVNRSVIKDLQIPLPPLPIQEAIVEILDKFESLQQGLQDELQARKKQYEYYRNKLLTQFPDNVQVKEVPLLHFAKNYTGLTYKPQDVSEKGKLVLRSSNIQNGQLCFDDNVFVDMNIPERSIVKKDDILVCVRNGSANLVGKAALITEQAAGMAFGAFMTILRVDNQEELDAHYLFHLWNSQYIKDQINGSEGAAIKQITNGMLKNINIRLPKLSIQKEISKKIDKFERLQQGLQDEIAAVKKQYEYYRNKLLTF